MQYDNFKQKKSQFLEDAKKFKEINASYYGHIKHADSYRLMKKYGIEGWINRGK